MTTIELPAYIDPAVLVPGARVRAVFNGEDTVFTVDHMEPAIIATAPDGTAVVLLAHSCVPADGAVPGGPAGQLRVVKPETGGEA